MEQNKFIGNAQIEFFRQFDSAAADRYAQYRKDFYTRKAEKAKQAKEQAELTAEKGQYFGWVDGVTPQLMLDMTVLLGL